MPPANHKNHLARSDGGVALLVVLMFILLLSAIVVEFSYETQVQASLTGNRRDEFEAYVAAKSAVAQGLALLESDLILPPSNTGGGSDPMRQALRQYQQRQAGQNVPQAAAGQTPPSDSIHDPWGQGLPMQPINRARMQCSIDDEMGKLNLNAMLITDANGNQQENPVMVNALRALFLAMGVEDDPTDAILDWLDTDNDTRSNGAESDEYQSLESPYSCKNGPMNSVEELLLIQGITPDLYFNCNRTETGAAPIMDPMRPDQTNPGLSDLLTVHGDPQGIVNVNTARPEVLEALITSANGGNAAPVEEIVRRRTTEPFESLQMMQQETGCPPIPLMTPDMQAALATGASVTAGSPSGKEPKQSRQSQQQAPLETGADALSVSSTMFKICGDGVCNGAMARIEAFVFRTPMEARSMQTSPQTAGRSFNARKVAGLKAFNPGSQTTSSNALEAFHILDWRVIR
ncbi:MAG TPA: general secretion pathway protein GspK [Candidatus Hydrogenedentes bacterium]|nr:general secretion pathway protein GspK [Candidatus Hydrogenedentota bacterium]HRT21171.1 general secretion pathway protein GspK [Candidatus Hydrogenedentota bacterium]HRT65952.1 general secretion pathway protein GspK [Candidatus Hydrogenedentota bacterium]